jgi:hypothetical protein
VEIIVDGGPPSPTAPAGDFLLGATDDLFLFASADGTLDRAAAFLELARLSAFLTGFLLIDVSSPGRI